MDVMAALDPLREAETPEKNTEVVESNATFDEPLNTRARTESPTIHYAHGAKLRFQQPQY
jgi:hypothetical protein